MSEIMEDIAYLSQEIGPRPAGTEEEQQAAFYISDALKNRTGFETQLEEFACNAKPDLAKVILCLLAIVVSIVAMIVDIAVIPAILIGILCAALYVPEAIGRPLLSRVFSRGVSQNVVSKYQPAVRSSRRTRKIVLVAGYDSGKIQKELGLVGILPVFDTASLVAMVAIPVLWIVRAAFGMEAAGAALIAWNAITAVMLVLAFVPVIFFIMHQLAQYNEAANCNAASVAAMMEVARLIANSPAVSEEPDPTVQIHGEAAARAEGLIPEGASIEYKVAPVAEVSADQAAPASLQPSEKADSAETGKADSFVYLNDQVGWPKEYSFEKQEESDEAVANPEPDAQDDSVPEWYRAAQAKAHRPVDSGAPVRRSRFASALDQAVETSHRRAQEAAAAQQAAREAAIASAFETARAASSVEVEPATRDDVQAPVPAERIEVEYEEIFPEPEIVENDVSETVHEEEPADGKPVARLNSLAMLAQQTVEDAIANGEDPSTFVPAPAVEEVPADESEREDSQVAEEAEQPEQQQEVSAGEHSEEASQTDEPVASAEDAREAQTDEPARGTVAIPRIDVSELRRDAAKARAGKVGEPAPASEEPAPVAPVIDVPAIGSQPANEPVKRNPLLDSPELIADLPQIDTSLPQRAPLAGDGANPSLSSRIPRVNLDAFGISTAGNAEPMDNKRAALRNMVPSLSGSISFEPSESDPEKSTVSKTGSFSPIEMSGSIGPVGDELIEGMDPEDIYVDDVDDSDYADNTTASGAYAGPDYMEMPESRVSRFLGKFRRKKDQAPSFQDADDTRRSKRKNDDGDQQAWDEDWNGGAFSKMREAAAGFGKKKDSEGDREQIEPIDAVEEDFEPVDSSFERDYYDDSALPAGDDGFQEKSQDSFDAGSDFGDALTHTAAANGNSLAAFVSEFGFEEDAAQGTVETEVKQIEDFHLKNVDVEVWFVALGSEYAANGGSRAFFEEHAEELRGALIVNLEGLGAGALCQVSPEGTFGAKVASPRLKRLVRKAQQVSGVTFTNAAIRWKDSIASLALKKGIHAVTLAGIENKKPAYMSQGDDVIENVDEETLYRRIEFIEALVRNA